MKQVPLVIMAVCLMTVMLSCDVRADEFRAEAGVDRNVVGVGGRLVLTIEVYGGGQVSGPDMADIEGFRVVNTSRSQTLSIVNFDAVRSLTLQYVLLAESEGEYVLGPFSIQSGKEIFETEPIKVTVTKGQAPPPAASEPGDSNDDAVRVRASVDKTRAYVGEQVTYNLEFAYRVRPRDVQYTPPDHTGFWTEEIGETGPTIETIDGRRYYVLNRRTAFFPISSGRYEIGGASVRYLVGDMNPFSFDPFDLGRGKEGRAVTEPVEIVVRPLPAEGRPSGFGGAVGSFNLAVSPSTKELKAGESLTLTVTIRGRGNIKSVGDIAVPEIQGFRVFAPKAKESSDVDGLKVGGEKTFDLVLVPESEGAKSIPEFEFSYFDPGKEAYCTLHSDPIRINVLPGDGGALASATGAAPGLPGARRDIRYIKRTAISRDSLAISGMGLPGFLIMYGPALVGLVGLIVSIERRRAAVSGKGAARRAYRSARLELKRGRDLAGQAGGVAEAAGLAARAVRLYAAAMAGTSEALIDRARLLSIAGIGQATKSDMADLLDLLDRIRFAPVGAESAEVLRLIDRAESLLKAAHSEWNR
jgi:hypothetical protein